MTDTCPLLDTCSNLDVSSGNFHWTQAVSFFKTLCWFKFIARLVDCNRHCNVIDILMA